jgi:hypothetical protein
MALPPNFLEKYSRFPVLLRHQSCPVSSMPFFLYFHESSTEKNAGSRASVEPYYVNGVLLVNKKHALPQNYTGMDQIDHHEKQSAKVPLFLCSF